MFSTMTEPILQESDTVSIGSKGDNILPKQDLKSEVPVPTCMPSGGDGEPLIICVVAGSGASAGTVISKTLTR